MTEALPAQGSKWIAGDGRHMIVEHIEKVAGRGHPCNDARHKVFVRVLNARGRMRKQTVIDANEFGESGKFLRPAGIADAL